MDVIIRVFSFLSLIIIKVTTGVVDALVVIRRGMEAGASFKGVASAMAVMISYTAWWLILHGDDASPTFARR